MFLGFYPNRFLLLGYFGEVPNVFVACRLLETRFNAYLCVVTSSSSWVFDDRKTNKTMFVPHEDFKTPFVVGTTACGSLISFACIIVTTMSPCRLPDKRWRDADLRACRHTASRLVVDRVSETFAKWLTLSLSSRSPTTHGVCGVEK